MTVWDDLVGQEAAVGVLRRAVAGEGHAMTHAWLITGPPGSGRSNAAKAFAAALQCERHGCGECQACRTSLAESHPDLTVLRIETQSIKVEQVKELVNRAAGRTSVGRYQVIVVEDADRITERAAPMLLKAIEEPAPRTVWVLCAPTPDDILVTIRSRCRHVGLVTPSDASVAELLIQRDRVDPGIAHYAARAAQGHIGRARALARNEGARNRRHEIVRLPPQLTTLGACLRAAENVVKAAAAEAESRTTDLNAREREQVVAAYGGEQTGARARSAQAALRDLEDAQKDRAKRIQRDELDRVLTELTTYYRDVLSVQLATGVDLINAEAVAPIGSLARRSPPEQTIRKLDRILETRTALEGNVAPLLAMEALMVGLGEEVVSESPAPTAPARDGTGGRSRG